MSCRVVRAVSRKNVCLHDDSSFYGRGLGLKSLDVREASVRLSERDRNTRAHRRVSFSVDVVCAPLHDFPIDDYRGRPRRRAGNVQAHDGCMQSSACSAAEKLKTLFPSVRPRIFSDCGRHRLVQCLFFMSGRANVCSR